MSRISEMLAEHRRVRADIEARESAEAERWAARVLPRLLGERPARELAYTPAAATPKK